MKKTFITSILICLAFICNAQKIVENPNFSATTASNVKITKIVLLDTITRIDFITKSKPNSWIIIPKKTHIQNSKGGEELYVIKGDGIEINQRHTTPENGINKYSLFFPPIEKSVQTIDYLEPQWKIFDLELIPQEHLSIIPESLLGNWFKTDGSNEWVYGFYNNSVIYKNEVWKQVSIKQKKRTFQLLLQKNDKKESLFIKQTKQGLLIGERDKDLFLYNKDKTVNADYVISNDSEFKIPVFKSDTAIFHGFLNGYHPKMGKTGMVYVNNLIGDQQTSHLITINPDGTFYSKFLMHYPQEIFIRGKGFSNSVFCEPGKSTFQLISLKAQNNNRSLFMGDNARINTDLLAMEHIRYFDYNDSRKKILDMTGEEYKVYCEGIELKEQNDLNDFIKENTICKKAIQIKRMQIPFRVSQNILSYNMSRASAYRIKNKVPRDQREIPLEKEKFEPEFYDFIDSDQLNNPLSVLAGSDYYYLINRVKFAEEVRPKNMQISLTFDDFIKELESRKIIVDSQIKELMKNIDASESIEEKTKLIKADSTLFTQFMNTHMDDYKDFSSNFLYKKQKEIKHKSFKKYFNLNSGFAMDVMNAQDVSHKMKSSFTPLTQNEQNELHNDIGKEFIINYLLHASLELENEIESKKKAIIGKKGFVINETPKANTGDVFDAIMGKYRGNLIFVDFWATWCGPCRTGMKRIKPLKEEFEDKNIKFVYITNPSSPKKTWEFMTPDVNGEHYRVTQDEWNVMSARFKIGGIPHYVLVDENGNVIKDKLYFASSNDELKKLFNEYLPQ